MVADKRVQWIYRWWINERYAGMLQTNEYHYIGVSTLLIPFTIVIKKFKCYIDTILYMVN